ncbi:MAG TPA: MoaD/ThiS family protein [Chloroflexi bacterium]|nr:MoaD/ThiS family protein [Chloroflexota bacterium]
MVEVHFYGKLRRYAPDPRLDRESVVRLEVAPGETVESVLKRLGIQPEEVAHLFLNGALLTTCNSMAPWLHYQRAREDAPPCEPAWDTPVRDGDRLGIFGHDMAMLVV